MVHGSTRTPLDARARRHLGRRARRTRGAGLPARGHLRRRRRAHRRRRLPLPAHARRGRPAPDQRGPPRAAVGRARLARARLRRADRRRSPAPRSRCGRRTPRASALKGDFNSWDGREHPMRQLGVSGVWELFVPGVGSGTHYKYVVLGADDQWREKADPMAFHTEVAAGHVVGGLRLDATPGATTPGCSARTDGRRAREADVDLRGAPRPRGGAAGPTPSSPTSWSPTSARPASRTSS